MENNKKIILSGIQPTGVFTLGNYLGAVRSWKQMQEDYNCYYFIADLHSMTIHIDPQKRRQQTREAFALLLACGIDPEKSLVFVQSRTLCATSAMPRWAGSWTAARSSASSRA